MQPEIVGGKAETISKGKRELIAVYSSTSVLCPTNRLSEIFAHSTRYENDGNSKGCQKLRDTYIYWLAEKLYIFFKRKKGKHIT